MMDAKSVINAEAERIPDEKKWVWQPESVVLRELGFYDPYEPAKDWELKKILGSIDNPNDPRIQALRLVIDDLRADSTKRYHLADLNDPDTHKITPRNKVAVLCSKHT